MKKKKKFGWINKIDSDSKRMTYNLQYLKMFETNVGPWPAVQLSHHAVYIQLFDQYF